MEDPVVQVKFSEYQKLREEVKTQQTRIYELEKQVSAAQLDDVSGTTKQLHEALHEALKIVQYAVGNLAPETVAGWPHQALINIADAIEKLPAMDAHIKEVPNDWREFAKLAAAFEAQRAERRKTQVVTMATAADFGPKTPDAEAAHVEYDKRRAAAGVEPGPAPFQAHTPSSDR
jgi:hypothetical protein